MLSSSKLGDISHVNCVLLSVLSGFLKPEIKPNKSNQLQIFDRQEEIEIEVEGEININ